MRLVCRRWDVAVIVIAIGLLAQVARADTLADAIALAYQTNPTLQSQRAQLMEADEAYVQARAALGPTARLQTTTTLEQTRFGYYPPGDGNNGQAQLTLTQPLYNSGANAMAVDAALYQIAAARQALRIAEGNVVLAVAQAYADVVRDSGALAVDEEAVTVLTDEVTESRARQTDGEITSTDVAQAEAQLAGARAAVESARTQLRVSRAEYVAAVGQNPGTLSPPPSLPGLPTSIDEAFALADRESPDLEQAKLTEASSESTVRVARAGLGPSVSLSVVGGYSGQIAPFAPENIERQVTAGITVNVPLFTSGLLQSRVRQALDQNTSDRISIELARRTEVQNLSNGWDQMIAARRNVTLLAEDVRANEAAFKGMRIEQRAGQRATLDVLITEQNLVSARLALLGAKHDAFVGEVTVLRVVGRLEAPDLVPGLPQYDVAANLRAVSGRGAVPWVGAIQALDALGAPGAGLTPIPAPTAIRGPATVAPSATTPEDRLSGDLPVAPVPGTVSPQPPPAPQS